MNLTNQQIFIIGKLRNSIRVLKNLNNTFGGYACGLYREEYPVMVGGIYGKTDIYDGNEWIRVEFSRPMNIRDGSLVQYGKRLFFTGGQFSYSNIDVYSYHVFEFIGNGWKIHPREIEGAYYRHTSLFVSKSILKCN